MKMNLLGLKHPRRASFASLIMILLISIFLMPMLPFSTANGSTSDIKVPPLTTIPNIDGKWSADEWDEAFEYTATNSTRISYVRAKWDGSFLFILIDSPWDTTNSSMSPYENTWVAFDTEHNNGPVPQTDDYLLSVSSMAAFNGDGDKWTSMLVPSGFQAQSSSSDEWGPGVQPSPKNSTPHRIEEFKIPLAYVGSPSSTVGFYFMVVDDSSDPDGWGANLPPTAWVEWPDGAGGDPRGWPGPPTNIDPCPAPSDWGHLTFLQPPTASFIYSPDMPDVNETVTFDASDSQDPDGGIANYTWNFGDGNVTTISTTTITHSFPTAGSFNVELTVTDNDGFNGSVVHAVTVGVGAVFTFSPPAPNPHDVVTFDATASYSRGGTIMNYTWNWDDTKSNVTTNPIITHDFSAGGSYDVTLTVTDDTGLNGSIVHTVYVGAPRANFTFWPSAPNLGDVAIFNASGSYDPDGNITSFTWNWGDSSSNVTTKKVANHTFSVAGNYTVSLTVADDLGINGSFARNVTVYALREGLFSFSPSTPSVGDTVTFNASLSKDPGGVIANYTWNFDDGNVTTVDVATTTHIFSANGSYNVNLTIADNDGLESWYNNAVDVGIPPVEATAPFSPMIPTIDGAWSLSEWADANEYTINGTGGEGYMLVKWGLGNITGDFLYILIDSPWDTTPADMSPLENAFVAFDTEHDKSTLSPQTDDYLFNDEYSLWNHAWKGDEARWSILSKTEINYTKTGYIAIRGNGSSPKNDIAHRIDEFRIPLNFVGAVNQTSGFYVIVIDDSTDLDGKYGPEFPPTAWVEWPSGAGGDSAGWPESPYIDPCPTPDKWGYLFLEPPTKASSNITLDISSSSIAIGESVTISGTVSDSTEAKAGVAVTIQYETGAAGWNNITTVTTNSTGSYTHSWKPTEAGTYQIKASWAGDAETYGAESEVRTLKVTSKSIPILVIAAALAVAAVVIAVAVYLLKVRKSKQ